MASSNSSLPLPESSTFANPPSLWSRESSSLKQGIKTGLAGTITYVIYAKWNLPQGYWAVFAALVVTQANLGASWKAAPYRSIGSTCGALAAALLMPYLVQGRGAQALCSIYWRPCLVISRRCTRVSLPRASPRP